MDLHNRIGSRAGEVRHLLGDQPVGTNIHDFQRTWIKPLTHSQCPPSFHYDDVLVFWMEMRHHNVARLGVNPDYVDFSCFFYIP